MFLHRLVTAGRGTNDGNVLDSRMERAGPSNQTRRERKLGVQRSFACAVKQLNGVCENGGVSEGQGELSLLVKAAH